MRSLALSAIYYCYNKAAYVILAWIAFAIAGAVSLAFYAPTIVAPELMFSEDTPAVQTVSKYNTEFPGLDNLAVIQVSGKTPKALRNARDEILLQLQEHKMTFRQAFAPGAGSYYDKYQVYHLSSDTVAARIDYALAVLPLIQAISKSRTIAGLTLILDKIGSAPGVTDNSNLYKELLDRLARAAQADVYGESFEVNWLAFGGLEFSSESKQSVILAWPMMEENDAANELLSKIAGTPFADATVEIAKKPPANVAKSSGASPLRLFAFAAIVLILIMLMVLVLSGDLGFAAIATACWLISAAAAAPLLALAGPWNVALLPFLLVGLLFNLTCHAHSLAALHYAASAEPHPSHFLEDFATRELPRRINICLVFFAALLGCLSYSGQGLASKVQSIFEIALVALLACATLLPAVYRFTDALAHANLMHRANSKGPSKLLLIAIAVLCYASILVLVHQLKQQEKPFSNATSQSVLATDADAAQRLAAQIKGIPAVASARWIGDFLPQESEAKRTRLRQLDVHLPAPAPPEQSGFDAKQAMTGVVVAVKKIADLANGSAELKAAASATANSLQNLLQVEETAGVQRFEKNVFSGLAKFETEIQALARLEPPSIEQLDPHLLEMFVSRQGSYRIEVEPAVGVSLDGLSLTLRANGIVPASQYLADLENRSSLLRAAFVVFGIGFLAAAPLLFVARVRLTAAVQSLSAMLFVCVAALSALVLTRTDGSEQLLLLAVPCFALLWTQATTSNVASRLGLIPLQGVNMLRELEWLVPLGLISAAVAALVVNLFQFAEVLGLAGATTLLLSAIMELLSVNAWSRD